MSEDDITNSMLQGMKEALDFANGESTEGHIAHVPEDINVQRIRQKFNMTQKDFSSVFGIELRTLQDWEQGRRMPAGASRNFLHIIDKEPEAVFRALNVDGTAFNSPNA